MTKQNLSMSVVWQVTGKKEEKSGRNSNEEPRLHVQELTTHRVLPS